MPLAEMIFKGKHDGTVLELFLCVCTQVFTYTAMQICVGMHEHKCECVWTVPWQYLEQHESIARVAGDELIAID